jgi:fucose permease
MRRSTTALLVGVSYLSFIALGLPAGILNVAWSSMRTEFGLTQDAIGALFIAHTTGYLLSGLVSGPMIARTGVGSFLLISSLGSVLGLAGYTLAPAWWIMLASGVVLGLGTGAIDAGLNTYFAANHGPSLMNWLHACFGLGAMLGPLLVSLVLTQGYTWRWAYAGVAVLDGCLAIAYAVTLKRWQLAGSGSPEAGPRTRVWATLRLSAVWVGVALFFAFTGLEASAPQWSYQLFTEARSVDSSTASLWVSIYWGSLTAGRILAGVAVRWIGVPQLLRLSALGGIAGSAMVWWHPTDLVSFLGLALLGFSLAPMFPLGMSITPGRVGAVHSANAIGFQVAAASLGLAVLPGLGGVLVETRGLESLGPFLLAFSVVTLALLELSRAPVRDASLVPEGEGQ